MTPVTPPVGWPEAWAPTNDEVTVDPSSSAPRAEAVPSLADAAVDGVHGAVLTPELDLASAILAEDRAIAEALATGALDSETALAALIEASFPVAGMEPCQAQALAERMAELHDLLARDPTLTALLS